MSHRLSIASIIVATALSFAPIPASAHEHHHRGLLGAVVAVATLPVRVAGAAVSAVTYPVRAPVYAQPVYYAAPPAYPAYAYQQPVYYPQPQVYAYPQYAYGP